MPYDFTQLNPREFEEFAVDLLSANIDQRIERFKPGKDRGVDGRYFSTLDEEIIVQCKHYYGTGIAGLLSSLKSTEEEKVKKLSPARYILVTSVPLSRDDKKSITSIFHPYIRREDDVWGNEDLNQVLLEYPEIEERTVKLWLQSSAVLKRLLNSAIMGRSDFEVTRIYERARKYVATSNHEKALKRLKDKNVVIISGEPGIGKTTLAENLCLHFIWRDFSLVVIEESLSEAENIFFLRGKKQVFYFDDFLGSNYIDAIENKKDAHVMNFIERVASDPTKVFILTSRTNILNHGEASSHVYSIRNLRKDDFVITIDSLSLMERAKILYNHIWFSSLDDSYIDEIYRDKRYHSIIQHRNFNPRLVEFVTDIDRAGIHTSQDYWPFIEKTFEDPKDIWADCFKTQNNEFVRSLVSLTVFNGGTIREDDLRGSYKRIIDVKQISQTGHADTRFNSSRQLATGSFLNRTRDRNSVSYTLFNPSISDYILGEYRNDDDHLVDVYTSLNSTRSLSTLVKLERSDQISTASFKRILDAIFDDAFQVEKSTNYLISISNLCKDHLDKGSKIVPFLADVVSEREWGSQLENLLSLAIHFHHELEYDICAFLIDVVETDPLTYYEMGSVAALIELAEIDDLDVLEAMTTSFEEYLRQSFSTHESDIDLSKIVTPEYGFEGEEEYIYDESDVRAEFSGLADAIIDEFDYETIRNLEVDIECLIDEIDISGMIDGYISSLGYDGDDNYEGGAGSRLSYDSSAIDDMFDRS